jgi:hypothetical protein
MPTSILEANKDGELSHSESLNLEDMTEAEILEEIKEVLSLQVGTGKKPLSAWCLFSQLVSAYS